MQTPRNKPPLFMSTELPASLKAALHQELKSIVEHDDFSPKMLKKLENTARAMHRLVLTLCAEGAVLEHSPTSIYANTDDSYDAGVVMGAFDTAVPASETAGMSIVRELVSGMGLGKKKREDIGYEASQLIDAIKEAERDESTKAFVPKLKARLETLLAAEEGVFEHVEPVTAGDTPTFEDAPEKLEKLRKLSEEHGIGPVHNPDVAGLPLEVVGLDTDPVVLNAPALQRGDDFDAEEYLNGDVERYLDP